MEADSSSRSSFKLPQADDTPAARYNRKLFKALKKELAKNPELDIAAALPKYYSDKLESFQQKGKTFVLPWAAGQLY
jgi:hypothetical protein